MCVAQVSADDALLPRAATVAVELVAEAERGGRGVRHGGEDFHSRAGLRGAWGGHRRRAKRTKEVRLA